MHARRPGVGVSSLIGVSGLVLAACAAPAPMPAGGALGAGADASADAASATARRCTPWTDPASTDPAASAAATPAGDAADAEPTDRHLRPQDPKDTCGVADSNLARAEKAILGGAGGAMAAHAAWDHKTPPARLDVVDRRYALTRSERALLGKNGFVVLARREFTNYAWALHDVYQSELPIYVSADTVLNAVYASNDRLIAEIETTVLVPALGRTLSAMHCALADAAAAYPPDTARDLDLYLTVARSLLADAPVPSVLGTDAEAAARIADAKKASGLAEVAIFGRDRKIDWSAYLPRGHYAKAEAPRSGSDGDDPNAAPEPEPEPSDGPSLGPYFRAATWLSRLELNLVSRSSRSSSPAPAPDPRETPREAVDALALADLVDRAHAQDDVARLDRAWTLLAGRREDVSVGDLQKLRQKAGIDRLDGTSFEKLKTAIGGDFQRTARLHPMPEGSTVLPAITTFLGPRVVADAMAFRPLVNGEVVGRYLVSSGDVAYVLGLDRGKTYLEGDLAKYPQLATNLDTARAIVNGAPDAGDLYGAWLGALRGVARTPSGVVPSFMHAPAYDDLRMNTLVTGYGQIRHNYVLLAGQSYDEGGCAIPDGWVEPLPEVYEGVARYAERGAVVMRELDPKDRTGSIAYFASLGKVSRVLGAIARHELEGRALTEEEKRFLGMVVEMTPGSSGGGPTYTGWYFDLFRNRVGEGLASSSFTADYHTSAFLGKVVYAGATGPRLGVFVVDAGGPPRLMVGPVARGYELVGSVAKRYDDTSGELAKDKRDPWATSYTADTVPLPTLAIAASIRDPKATHVILRAGPAGLPRVVVDAIDHHHVPLGTVTRSVPPNGRVMFSIRTSRDAEGIRVRVGEFSWDDLAHGAGESVSLATMSLKLDDKDWAALTSTP